MRLPPGQKKYPKVRPKSIGERLQQAQFNLCMISNAFTKFEANVQGWYQSDTSKNLNFLNH